MFFIKRALDFGLSYRSMGILVFLSLISIVTEIFGIGLFIPIFQFIRMGGNIETLILEAPMWQHAENVFNAVGINLSIVSLLIIAFMFFILRQVFTYLRLVYATKLTQYLVIKLRNRLFNMYLSASTSYHDKLPVGNLVNVMTSEISGGIAGIMAPIEVIVYVILLIGYLSGLLLLSWGMTIAAIVILFFAALFVKKWVKKSTVVGRSVTKSNIEMSTFLVGRLKSPRIVKLAGTFLAEKKEFDQLTKNQYDYTIRGSILKIKAATIVEPIVIGYSFFFIYLSYTFFNMSIEMIGVYIAISFRILPTVKSILKQWQITRSRLGSIEVVTKRILEMRSYVEQDKGELQKIQFDRHIEYCNIDFKYKDSANNVLNNISTRIMKGSLVGLVGPSGSGKSTFIDLLPRLRDATSGTIKIDGESIGNYSLKALRKFISYVPQSPQIFNGTIKNHISYGNLGSTDEEIITAAKLAGLDDFVKTLPSGYDTLIGDDGIGLSGGQKQRLDLSRALLSRSPVLILDEPTSNLDIESEAKFKLAIHRIKNSSDTTIIIISHSLPIVRDADVIVVLNNGNIDAMGSHNDIVNTKNWYSKFF